MTDYTLSDAAWRLGTTKNAINAHRRRKEWDTNEMYKDDSGNVMVTQAGMDRLASMIRTPEAQAYIEARDAEGAHIVLSEDVIELEVGPYNPASIDLSPPVDVGRALAQAKYQQDMETYMAQVTEAAEVEYQKLGSDAKEQVGNSLAQRWGLPIETVRGLL